MLGGLYGDLPPPSDDDKPSGNSVWSSSTKMAPPTLRKPPAFAPTQTILRPQNKPKPIPSQYKPPPPKYDPARPNDYEECRREKKRKAEMKRELDKRRHEEKRETEPPPPLNISGEEAWKRRGGRSRSASSSSSPPPETSPSGQMTAAERMMAKMGWKQGQGLGKSEQGITTPLMAKKTDRRAGVIVNASENKVKSVSISGEPTRVLLLINMVGPGEVDDELEEEVGSESNFPTHEAVRIFVQFSRPEETTKALVDLDGRFFGGRTVRATFYDEVKFSKNELAPVPGEIPGY
ncbi:hypothetical protein Bca52824_032682 [Brassica carinata]|uniref:G-patch domain-containing protein n=1 Tax=Brassica carinata TaxID=52824 RepID=A0A8X7SCV9_BRACI|nr:hypothetical protein Bca52824_032682 [Brassica carinata]